MIVILKPSVSQEQKEKIIKEIESYKLTAHVSEGVERTIIGAIGHEEDVIIARSNIDAFEGVESIIPILKPFKLASRDFKSENSVIKIGKHEIGGDKLAIMAGPCTVENEEMLLDAANKVKKAGANFLRGGAFKPRSSPYAFQGMGEEGLKILNRAKKETGLLTVSEVMDARQVEVMVEHVDILQVGARNMQNFTLLKELGMCKKPILLKRGMMATIKEFLMSAEYILSEGNYDVLLCERGIRTFEDSARNSMDINAIPVIKEMSHLPIIVDPSHATGKRSLVSAVSKAAIAAGADGLIIEVHPNPEKAAVDGAQSLFPEQFEELMKEIKKVAAAVGRRV